MNMPFQPPQQPPSNPFSRACQILRDAGFSLEPSDIPGLTIVHGRKVLGSELTMNQVIDLADQVQAGTW